MSVPQSKTCGWSILLGVELWRLTRFNWRWTHELYYHSHRLMFSNVRRCLAVRVIVGINNDGVLRPEQSSLTAGNGGGGRRRSQRHTPICQPTPFSARVLPRSRKQSISHAHSLSGDTLLQPLRTCLPPSCTHNCFLLLTSLISLLLFQSR